MTSRSVLLRNMFDPEECVVFTYEYCFASDFRSRESGNDWDRELADDVKGECEGKYGPVLAIKVERDSQVSIVRLLLPFRALTLRRARSTLSLIPLNLLKKRSMDSMPAGLAAGRFPPHSYPMPLCWLISDSVRTGDVSNYDTSHLRVSPSIFPSLIFDILTFGCSDAMNKRIELGAHRQVVVETFMLRCKIVFSVHLSLSRYMPNRANKMPSSRYSTSGSVNVVA